LDEGNMSVFAFPPTPQKTPSASATTANPNDGISSQILPLSRLSMSGGSTCSTSPVLTQDDQVTTFFFDGGTK
jgi:hypothetical protein